MATSEQIKQVLKTLPIGYYLGRKMQIEVNDSAETSYFDATKQIIVISTKIILKGLANIPNDDAQLETFVRTMLYHEISHVILTPTYSQFPPYFNVFEDERIETVLQDYYYNVNFKEVCKAICKDALMLEPTNVDQYWFKLVRFRIGKPEHLQTVKSIIHKYHTLSAMYQSYEWFASQYFVEVKRFYESIKQELSVPQIQLPQMTPDTNIKQPEQSDNQQTIQLPVQMIDDSADSTTGFDHSSIEQIFKQAAKTMIESSYSKQQIETLNEVFKLIRQKQSRFGGSTVGYSGVLDPRQTTRKDYRFFVHESKSGSIKRLSKVKLNLFIDCSGSYRDNAEATNKIINALKVFKQSESDFDFDVVTLGSKPTLLPKDSQVIVARGCSYMYAEIQKFWRSIQSNEAININVVLLDGMFDNDWNFKYFNHQNCSIISDETNKSAIEKYAPKAKLIVMSTINRRYSDKLLSVISQELLRQAKTI